MARYKDVEGYRKLFDEEYKKTRKLISEGETHLDNLAEGFSEASRVIDRMPTAEVVPKSEVERIFAEIDTALALNLIPAHVRGVDDVPNYYEGDLGEAIENIKQKYTEEKT